MLNRRQLLAFTSVCTVAAGELLPRLAHAQSATGKAAAFIKSTGDRLVSVVNGPGDAAQKRQQLTKIVDDTVDVDGIARFCLGRFWRQASPDQQKRYLAAFHQVLVTSITAKIGEYQGVKFTMGQTQPRGENEYVSTTIDRPNNPPANVEWVVANAGSKPEIVDVIAEGTSLRLTQRSDYASYLSRNNNSIDALITAMRQQVSAAQQQG
jgi:phospholipid transport system substrate-binding protein